MGLPTLDKFSPQCPSSQSSAICIGPTLSKPNSSLERKLCVEYWLFKRMPSGKWCGLLARGLVKLWGSPEPQQAGNPSPGPCCPSGNPPTPGVGILLWHFWQRALTDSPRNRELHHKRWTPLLDGTVGNSAEKYAETTVTSYTEV